MKLVVNRTLSQVGDLIARLPVTDASFPILQALLALPYDVFVPILDMLFDGTITPEDLVLSSPGEAAAARLAVDSAAATAAYLGPWSGTDGTDGTALAARCAALLGGAPPAEVVLPRDASAVALGPGGAPAPDGAFAPSVPLVASADPQTVAPNPIEVARAGSRLAAARATGAALAAIQRPGVS